MSVIAETMICRNSDILANELDDEVIMMSMERGEYYALDAIGSRIWHLIEQPLSMQSLCDSLCTEFEVSAEDCRKDVLTFIAKLQSMELIHTS